MRFGFGENPVHVCASCGSDTDAVDYRTGIGRCCKPRSFGFPLPKVEVAPDPDTVEEWPAGDE